MKLETAETKIELSYIPGDTDSMTSALEAYTVAVCSGEAFEYGQCTAHFVNVGAPIPKSIFKAHSVLADYIEPHTEPLEASMTGEALFFAYAAAAMPEMRAALETALTTIVRHVREVDDSSAFWLTDEWPIACEPLYALAAVYPQYGYLLAATLVPNWDDEHMPEPLYTLGKWVATQGVTEETLKAFCYCDNKRAREIALGYDTWNGYCEDSGSFESTFDILTAFRTDSKLYVKFPKVLADRYADMPYKRASSAPDESPIQEMLMEMLYVHHPCDVWDDAFDSDAYMTQRFVDTPADIAAAQLTEQVTAHLGHAIVVPVPMVSEEALCGKIARRRTEAHSWETFFENHLENGEAVWRYVTWGTPLALDALPELDLMSLAYQLEPSIQEAFEHVDDVTEGVYEALRDFGRTGGVSLRMPLRLHDVLHRLTGCPPVSLQSAEWLLSRNDGLTLEALYKRCPADAAATVDALFKEAASTFRYDRMPAFLLEAYTYALTHSRPLLLKKFQSVSDADEVKSYLLFYTLQEDSRCERSDELTTYAADYIDAHLWAEIESVLTSDGDWEPESSVRAAEQTADISAYHKAHLQRISAQYALWQPMRTYLETGSFKGRDPIESPQLALAYLKAHLETEAADIADKQPAYVLLDTLEGRADRLCHMCCWGRTREDLALRPVLLRVLELLIQLAPLRVIKALTDVEPDLEALDDPSALWAALDGLKTLGLPEPAYWIYPLTVLGSGVHKKRIAIYALDLEPQRIQTYVQLLEMYSASEPREAVPLLMQPAYRRAREAIRAGGLLVPRRIRARLVREADEVFGTALSRRKILDDMAIDYIKRTLYSSFLPLGAYVENVLKAAGITVSRRVVFTEHDGGEEAVNALRALGFDLKSAQVENSAFFVNLVDGQPRPLSVPRSSETLPPHIEIATINQCPESFQTVVQTLDKVDYRMLWLEQVDAFIAGKVPYDAVEDILHHGVNDGDFLAWGSVYDFELEVYFKRLDEGLKRALVTLIGGVDVSKLTSILDDSADDWLIDSRINRQLVFEYLLYKKAFRTLERLCLTVNCTSYVKALKIDAQAIVLKHLAKYPQYHPMVLDYRNHSSLKLRSCVADLMAQHGIEATIASAYEIVDYGGYTVPAPQTDSSGRKIAAAPICHAQTDVLSLEVGLYIGLRFTAKVLSQAPKVCVHNVVVTHPSPSGQCETSQWQQDGYSSSPIFMGWCFESESECLPGRYHFAAYDLDGHLLVEKTLHMVADGKAEQHFKEVEPV